MAQVHYPTLILLYATAPLYKLWVMYVKNRYKLYFICISQNVLLNFEPSIDRIDYIRIYLGHHGNIIFYNRNNKRNVHLMNEKS